MLCHRPGPTATRQGDRLFICGRTEAGEWALEPAPVLPQARVISLQLMGRGYQLLVADKQVVRLFEQGEREWEEAGSFACQGVSVCMAAKSAHDDMLAIAYANGVVEVWHAIVQRLVCMLTARPKQSGSSQEDEDVWGRTQIAFSGDGQLIILRNGNPWKTECTVVSNMSYQDGSWKEASSFTLPAEEEILEVLYSKRGHSIGCYSADKQLVLY